jgi:uncharacterized RDD family membrane protein YckC
MVVVSDIPVGSPPVPPGRHAAPGGWYPDPVDPAQERYWDGWQWSRNTRPRAGAAPRGMPPAGPGYAAYGPVQQPGGYPGPHTGYPAAPPVRTGPVATTGDGVPLAGWWWRVLAAVIDSLLVSGVVSLLSFPVWRAISIKLQAYFEAMVSAQQTGGALPAFDATTLMSPREQLIITAVSLGVGMLYHVGFLRWKAATVGKLICGLRVVPVDRGRFGETLSWNTCGIRSAIRVLPGLTSILTLFALVDVLFPLWHPKRQAIHDLAARTQVVRPGPAAR